MNAPLDSHEPWNDEERGELTRAREVGRHRVHRLLFMAVTTWCSVFMYGFAWGVI